MKILAIVGLFLTWLLSPASVFSGGHSPTPESAQNPFQNLLPIIRTASQYKFPQYTVTNVIIVPADIDLDPDYPRLVSEAVKTVQTRFSELLDGQTFQINQENGDPVIVKSGKPLGYFCNPLCNHNHMSDELRNTGFPVFQNQTVLNVFGAGFRNFGSFGLGDWDRNTDSGMTWMGEYRLSDLKGTQKRENEILCAAMFGMPCDASSTMKIITHELGHSFGLLMASRWANFHPCTVATTDECKDDLNPKFYPGIEESSSIMSQGSRNLQYNFNDSCVNPEKTLLKNSKFLGGKGYGGLNFEKCLSPTTEDIKIINIEANEKVYPGDTIVLQTEGLQPTDKETKIFFSSAWDLALNFKRTNINRLEVSIPPRSFGSGNVVVTVTRENNRTVRSNPYPVNISTLAPRLDNVDPSQAKPGDIITLTGENFIIDTEILKSLVPIVKIGPLQVEDFIEYDNKHIKLQIPQNVSLGINSLQVEVQYLHKGFHSLIDNSSNTFSLQIIGSPAISAKLEGPNTAQVGKAITLLATIDSENTLFESAEVLVQIPETNRSCNERKGTWCKVGSTALPVKATIDVSYTPQESRLYLAVINAYGKEGVKCSGDPNRPPDWIDCGEQSRLYIKVVSNQIYVSYSVVNNSEKRIGVSPKICEIINGLRACRSFGYKEDQVLPIWPNTSKGFLYTFYDGIEWVIKESTQYEISCDLYLDEGQERGKVVSSCPSRIVRVGERIKINVIIKKDGSTESFESSPAAEQTTQNLQKSVVGILVNGQRLGFGGTSVSIRLPDIVARGATHAVPITISYSGKDGFVSRNLIFRYVVPGSENSGESFDKGQECNPVKYSCFVMAEQESGSPERLFCRNMGDGYKWVTQKHAYELCQGKEGITSLCKDKEGNETTYYCTGQDWANEAGWKEYQEKLKKAQEASKPHEVLPQGPLLERLRQLEEESKGLSCSLEAYPQRIKVGQEITWIIKIHNFTGTFAEWRGTDNGQELVIPVPVHEFPKPNSPNLWMENYPYNRGGIYTRYAVIKDVEGRTCQTNTLEAVIEDSSIAQGLPGGEALTSITRYVNQIQPKTVSKIILLLPPYGQQREVQTGERTQFSLPDTGGVPQTIQLPISIIYSDGSTRNKTISFAYKGNTCSLSNGKCATDGGNTADGYTCTTYRSDLTGCPRNDRYAYCFTSCTKQPSTTTQTTPSGPTTAQPKTCQDLGGECIYANYTGTAPDGRTCKTYLGDEVSRSSCQQYYYCWKDCTSSPQQTTPSISQTEPTSTCNRAGEFCADSAGTPKDPNIQCNATKAYRNNAQKDQWCQGGEPGWYCWLCQ